LTLFDLNNLFYMKLFILHPKGGLEIPGIKDIP